MLEVTNGCGPSMNWGPAFETVVLIVVVLDANRLDEADVEHV